MAQGAQQQWKKMSEATDPGTEYRSSYSSSQDNSCSKAYHGEEERKEPAHEPHVRNYGELAQGQHALISMRVHSIDSFTQRLEEPAAKTDNKKKRNTRVKDHPSCARAEFCPRRTQGKHHAIMHVAEWLQHSQMPSRQSSALANSKPPVLGIVLHHWKGVQGL
eukprot:CAMPEP_0175896520 /NCGR_PEP_ID=MMETSP0108-20121206/215_1 /TAXON_ID=195067 ORGANISM="Goniomonas pacifica, Strain CCMP1869" /NCGR_SAMPLE_ID=MMETSP0108 /ASSEMBLY_ACC=CAM_ASM_000204 /LENGTH=162 /DNA_ID=CAMNT_0017217727 /DNA_START=139 /DNA_END=627 /DNA_ORIENTATION=-